MALVREIERQSIDSKYIKQALLFSLRRISSEHFRDVITTLARTHKTKATVAPDTSVRSSQNGKWQKISTIKFIFCRHWALLLLFCLHRIYIRNRFALRMLHAKWIFPLISNWLPRFNPVGFVLEIPCFFRFAMLDSLHCAILNAKN